MIRSRQLRYKWEVLSGKRTESRKGGIHRSKHNASSIEFVSFLAMEREGKYLRNKGGEK
jgi:hypothetical protein